MSVLKQDSRPASCSSIPINISGLVGFLITVFLLEKFNPPWDLSLKVTLTLFFTALPIIFLDFVFDRSPLLTSIIRRAKLKKTINVNRVVIKLLALYVIFALVAFIYWLFPEYGSFYNPFWDILMPLFPWLILSAIPYFIIVDKYMGQPEDAYYLFGSWLLMRCQFDKDKINQLFLGWIVKLFFLPLMLVYFSENIQVLLSGKFSWNLISSNFKQFYDFSWLLLFSIDLVFTCMGYILTMRLLNSHIRSTDQTTLGWGSALICYQPFFSGVSGLYFAYNMDNYEWGSWLENSPILFNLWGSLILICLVIYTFSTVMFGIRFSNLTNRGIITNGPYRFVKHPAYLSKNLSWWLIAIPFISQSNNTSEILRSCIMLLCLNGIYYLRAKTEEKHLLKDNKYKEYSIWHQKYGTFNRLKKLLNS